MLDDVLELVGGRRLQDRQDADHDAEHRQDDTGEGEEFGANAYGGRPPRREIPLLSYAANRIVERLRFAHAIV